MIELPSLKEIISKYDLTAKKSLGQNFLLDENLTNKIVKASSCNDEDIILEIGPGPGGLTRSILRSNVKKLILIERDKRFLKALNELKDVYKEKIEIIEGDALEIDFKSITQKGIRVVANLPYNISTVLLFKFLDHIEHYKSLTLMFQKEVADRIIARPKTKQYGRISVMTQAFCDVKHVFNIPARAFVPSPKIDSSVINIIPNSKNDNISKNMLSNLCKTVFNQRRKLLKSTIKPLIAEPIELFKILDIHEKARAEEMSVEKFIDIIKYMS